MDERPGNRNPLLLSTGDPIPPFPYDGVKPVFHGKDFLRQGALPKRFLDFLFRKGITQGDIFPNGGVEQKDVLRNVAHLPLQLLRRKIPDFRLIN